MTAFTVRFEAQWAPTGTDEWQNFNEVRGEESDKPWVVAFNSRSASEATIEVTAKYKPNRQLEFRAKHPSRGQYDYRMRRTMNVAGDTTTEYGHVGFRALHHGPSLPWTARAWPPRGQDRPVPQGRAARCPAWWISSTPSSRRTSRSMIRDTETWVTQHTRNCAWAMVDVMHSEVSGYGEPYSRIDVDEFLDLAERCDDRSWYFDAVIDFDCSEPPALQLHRGGVPGRPAPARAALVGCPGQATHRGAAPRLLQERLEFPDQADTHPAGGLSPAAVQQCGAGLQGRRDLHLRGRLFQGRLRRHRSGDVVRR